MSELFLHKRRGNSIFHLLGEHENDITYSVAWALSQSAGFLNTFLQYTLGFSADPDSVIIRLQQPEREAGITDIEIESPGRFFLIVEAKRGWNLPTRRQLEMYACRHSFIAADGVLKRILPLSECGREFALHNFGCQKIAGIDLQPISWKEMAMLASKAQECSSHAEKRLLRELLVYLRGLISMQNTESNWVYVVSLGPGTPPGWTISWIDIVKKKSAYFHPVGETWPKEPPNYIAFRYGGKLQSIHHIEESELFTNPHTKFPEIPNEEWLPHFLYALGPAFAPAREVKTGNIYPNGRVRCMLDTLFTSDTISQARDISRKRIDGVLAVDEARRLAMLHGDFSTLDSLLADDATIFWGDGTADDKASTLALLRSGRLRYAQLDYENNRVRLYGGTAVVTGQARVKEQSDNVRRSYVVRVTRVYVCQQGRWRLVASQTTRLTPL